MAEPRSPLALSTLARFKTYSGVGGTEDDDKWLMLLNAVSRDIENYCKRRFIRGSFTEYFNGDGLSNQVFVKNPPIISITSVHDDPDRVFGSASLIPAADYVNHDDPEGGPGVIELIGGGTTAIPSIQNTNFMKGVRNVKVIYVGSYARYAIETGVNDKINFNEGGSEITATLLPGEYEADELETEIKTRLDAAGSDVYTITYDDDTNKITIASDGTTFELLWKTGTNGSDNTEISVGTTIGFTTTADDTGETSYEADDASGRVPSDIERSLFNWVLWQKERMDSGYGTASKSIGDGSVTFIQTRVPRDIKLTLDRYRHRDVLVM